LIEEITEAVFELSSRHLGALIAIERGTEIQAQIESGVETDSLVSKELLVTVFHPKTPLHDGGLVIRNDRLAAAACIFPVTQRTDLDRNLGLRHRAALGLTEETDAVVVIVSEETGIVSIAHGGTVERDFEPGTFRNRLTQLLTEADHEKAVHSKSRSQTTLSRTGIHPVARHQEESD
jgi:diadenylate cyclase